METFEKETVTKRLGNLQKDIKLRASTYYIWTQALFSIGEYYKSIELSDKVIFEEPLYGDELIAFIYIKAEANLKLNNKKIAKELYHSIKKENANYRQTEERLKLLEAIK